MSAVLALLVAISLSLLLVALDAVTGGWLHGAAAWPAWHLAPLPLSGFIAIYVIVGYVVAFMVWRRAIGVARKWWSEGDPPDYVRTLVAWDERFRTERKPWTVMLGAYVVILAALFAPLVLTGGVAPVAWSLFSLVGVTLLAIYVNGAPRSPTAAAPGRWTASPAPPGQPPGPADLVRALRESKSYRGQMRAVRVVDERGPGAADLDDQQHEPVLDAAVRSLGLPGLGALSGVQRIALGHMTSDSERPSGSVHRRHIAFATGPGSGRRLALFLGILDLTLVKGGHVLIVCPDDEALDAEQTRFEDLARRTAWKHAITSASIRAGGNGAMSDPPSEILFCTVDSLHDPLLSSNRAWSAFFADLELVVLHGADQYRGIRGANAAGVFRRLRLVADRNQATPQFAFFSRPASNLSGFLRRLVGLPDGEQILVLGSEGDVRAGQIQATWLPALDRMPSAAPGARLTRQLSRQPFIQTLSDVVATLLGSRAIVEVVAPEWSASQGESFGESVSKAIGRPIPRGQLQVSAGDTDAGRHVRGAGAIILVGDEWIDDVDWWGRNAGLSRGGALVLVTSEPSAAATHLTRQVREGSLHRPWAAPLSYVLDAEHPLILEKHLLCAAAEGDISLASAAEFFGETAASIVQQWLADGRAEATALNARPRAMGSDPRAAALTMAPDVIKGVHGRVLIDTVGYSEAATFVGNADEPILAFDAARAAWEAFPGRRVRTRGQTYLLGRQADRADIVTSPDVEETYPVYLVHAKVGAEAPTVGAIAQTGGGAPFGVLRAPMSVEATLVQVRSVRDRTDPRKQVLRPLDPQVQVGLETEVLSLFGATGAPLTQNIAHGMAHLLRQALARTFRLPPTAVRVVVVDEFEPVSPGPAILAFEPVERGLGLVHAAEGVIDRLLADCYRQLLACPCGGGCVSCLYDHACSAFVPEGTCSDRLDKRELLRWLGAVLGEEVIEIGGATPDELDALRYELVSNPDDLQRIRDQVVSAGLPAVFGIDDTAQPAPVAIGFFPRTGASPNVAGVFKMSASGERTILVRPDTEEALVGVIAHELAHDWAFTPGPDGSLHMAPALSDPARVPYNGLLVQEGFAQWMELRVLDAMGFKQDLSDIVFRLLDEYGEGYHVVKEIEDEEGISGVLRFLHSEESVGKLIALMERAGTMTRIRDALRRALEGGLEPPTSDATVEPPPAEQPAAEQPGGGGQNGAPGDSPPEDDGPQGAAGDSSGENPGSVAPG